MQKWTSPLLLFGEPKRKEGVSHEIFTQILIPLLVKVDPKMSQTSKPLKEGWKCFTPKHLPSSTKSQREMPRNCHKKIAKKGLWKSPKRKNGKDTSKPWGTTPNDLYIPKRFIQGLACRPIILLSHKISPWSSQASPRNSKGKRKGRIGKKWDRVPRDGCHPLTPWVIWRQPED
jgi:hypothetical protein